MNPLTDIQLTALLGDLESDRVERKEAWAGSAPEKVREAVCAFANDLPNHQQPGVIFIGACDDGTPAATPITDQLLLTLADIKTDGRIGPPPTRTVEKVLNLVQRFGVGISIAQSSLRANGNPPATFQVESTTIFARIKPTSSAP